MMNEAKGVVYSTRTLMGNNNWVEANLLEEFKRKKFFAGDLLLSKFNKMTDNLNAPTVLTSLANTITFGAKFTLLAPHVTDTNNLDEGNKGMLLGGRISSEALEYTQDLCEGCQLVGVTQLQPVERTTFVFVPTDSCDREKEAVNFGQEFFLAIAKSMDSKPLYVRYDPNPIPGVASRYPLFLCERPARNARWRILPLKSRDKTRFEMEGHPVPVNKDIIINHSSTNLNLSLSNHWGLGFYGKIRAPIVQTFLDKYGRDRPESIWQIHTSPSSSSLINQCS